MLVRIASREDPDPVRIENREDSDQTASSEAV